MNEPATPSVERRGARVRRRGPVRIISIPALIGVTLLLIAILSMIFPWQLRAATTADANAVAVVERTPTGD